MLLNSYRENKKSFWRDVNKIRKSIDNLHQVIKDVNGVILKNK